MESSFQAKPDTSEQCRRIFFSFRSFDCVNPLCRGEQTSWSAVTHLFHDGIEAGVVFSLGYIFVVDIKGVFVRDSEHVTESQTHCDVSAGTSGEVLNTLETQNRVSTNATVITSPSHLGHPKTDEELAKAQPRRETLTCVRRRAAFSSMRKRKKRRFRIDVKKNHSPPSRPIICLTMSSPSAAVVPIMTS